MGLTKVTTKISLSAKFLGVRNFNFATRRSLVMTLLRSGAKINFGTPENC
jgi:hypothetical protein